MLVLVLLALCICAKEKSPKYKAQPSNTKAPPVHDQHSLNTLGLETPSKYKEIKSRGLYIWGWGGRFENPNKWHPAPENVIRVWSVAPGLQGDAQEKICRKVHFKTFFDFAPIKSPNNTPRLRKTPTAEDYAE